MTWLEQNQGTRTTSDADAERAALLSLVKKETLPVIHKEVDSGDKPFEPVKFQPVRSPGLFISEFGVKGADLIFHFWPYGYQEAERTGKVLPRFQKEFMSILKKILNETFDENRLLFADDKDVGAICVIAKGWGANHFFRELSIKAMQALHTALGGES